MLLDRIASFIAAPSSADDFAALALETFAFQFERIAPFRALCERRGASPTGIDDWRDVPLVPVLAYRSLELAAAPAVELFRTSGTSGAARGVHRHPFPELYRATIDASFPAACLPRGDRPPILALVPSRQLVPDSSLGFMVAHLLERFGGPGSGYAFGERGVDLPQARSWLAARQRAGQPVVLFATAFALADLLDGLTRLELRFRLPSGSAVVVTGGFKGRRREVSSDELAVALASRLDLPPAAIVGEYGMTELTSQCYTATLHGGAPEVFVPPPWVRVRLLDPESLVEAPTGEVGLVAIFDLANLGSAVHLLTEDLGVAEGAGFRLVGRAAGAALRGCSLLAEELSARG